jgi:hypothetical protein
MNDQSLGKKEAIRFEKIPHLKFLNLDQIRMIDEALGKVGEFGEVRLIVERGRLRFLVTEQSFDVLKWESGWSKGQETVEGI